MARNQTLVHVTHEAVGKIGGIGAVLEGMFTCKSYLDVVNRSILVGPLFTTEGPPANRLGRNGELLYSSIDAVSNTRYARALSKVEQHYKVNIIYGRKSFTDKRAGITGSPEVVLIDVKNAAAEPINRFKRRLFDEFGIRSDLYENLWEYEEYIRLACPALDVLKIIGVAKSSTTIVAHEFMGMPTALAAILEPSCDYGTVFYAHEVAPMRNIIEKHPGHDTMFYNVMQRASERGLYVEDVFGDQSSYFKYPLVDAAQYCDCIYAVGDYVVDELRFLSPKLKTAEIDLVYNGVPAFEIDAAEKLKSKTKLRRYCNNLLGFEPDFIFTHVTRLVQSKGLWRDIRVLEHLEQQFRRQGATGVFFLLATEVAARPSSDINNMESEYSWPVAHREGWPDLSNGEADFYTAIQQFNARSSNIKIVFINQFGFRPSQCGSRMPQDMEFMDIRKGSDVEFGQSIYEPFGISQFETLSFGGICVVTNVCGCTGFLHDVTSGNSCHNVIIADYTDLADTVPSDLENMLRIDRVVRNRIETAQSKKVADEILTRLPKDDAEVQAIIHDGYELAKKMSWETVVKNYLLKSLENTHAHRASTVSTAT